MSSERDPRWVTTEWNPHLPGEPLRRVGVRYFFNPGELNPDKGDVPVIGLPGFAEHALAARVHSRLIGEPNGVLPLPFHELEPTAANLQRIIEEVPLVVASDVNERLGRDEDDPVDVEGSSLGAGSGLMSVRSAPERYRNFAALAPLGPASEDLGETEGWRAFGFFKAITLGARPSDIIDPGNAIHVANMVRELAAGALKRRIRPQTAFAFSNQVHRGTVEGFQMLTSSPDHDAVCFVGEKDPAFQWHVYHRVLGAAGCSQILFRIPGNHTNALSAAGRRQVRYSVGWLRDVRARIAEQNTAA